MSTKINGSTGVDAPGYAQGGFATKELIQSVLTNFTSTVSGTTAMSQTTLPTTADGIQALTATITPKVVGSRIVIEVSVLLASTVAPNWMSAALFQGSTLMAARPLLLTTSGGTLQITMVAEMTASSLAALTFNVRVGGNSGGTTYVNGNGGAAFFGGVLPLSSINLKEFTP